MPADPTELGPYKIARPVGRGGMGVVYEAVHTGLNKRVALKVLPEDFVAARLERFLREARTAAALHHTNVVPVFDVGVADGVPYYAMQFIDGRPLDSLLTPPEQPVPPTRTLPPDRTPARTVPDTDATAVHDSQVVVATARTPDSPAAPGLPPKPAVRLILQAAEGVAYAHVRGVVHRDIKPSNLLLDADGVVWVADFGLAFQVDDPALTHHGAVVGTPRYMSPEQAEAKRTDFRTDVYSLGVTLYELLTGVPAFPGDSYLSTLNLVLTHTPPGPRSLNPKVPRDLETVVLKAMARRSEDRYPTGREFADDLRRFLNGEPVKARRIGVVGRAWRWAKRNPTVASQLVLILLVFAIGATVSGFFARQAEHREKDANQNAKQARENEERAKRNEDLARQNEEVAKKERDKVQDAEAANRRLLYAARVNLAGVALRENNYPRVAELLRETFQPDIKPDLRGWEWHYLFRTVYSESRVKVVDPATLIGAGDGRFLEWATADGQSVIRVRDAADWNIRFTHPIPVTAGSGWPITHAVTPDGRWVAFPEAGAVTVWDTDTGHDSIRVPVGDVPTPQIALAAGGRWLASAVPDPHSLQGIGQGGIPSATFRVWDVRAGVPSDPLPAPPEFGAVTGPTRAVRLSPDGRWLAVLDDDGRLVVWDVPARVVRLDRPGRTARGEARAGAVLIEGPALDAPNRLPIPPDRALAIDPRGRWLAVRSAWENVIELYDLATPNPPTPALALSRFAGPVTAVEFDPDGRRLVVADVTGTLSVVDTTGAEARQDFRTTAREFRGLQFGPSGTRMYAYTEGRSQGRVHEWDLTRPAVARLTGEPGLANDFQTAAFDPGGTRLVLTGFRGSTFGVEVLDTANVGPRKKSAGWFARAKSAGWFIPETACDGSVGSQSASWSSDGASVAFVVSGADGYRVAVADAATGHVRKVFPNQADPLTRTAFSPGGEWVAAWGQHAVVFSATDDRAPRVSRSRSPAGDRGVSAVFAADGKSLLVVRTAVPGPGSELVVLDLSTGTEQPHRLGHLARLSAGAVSPDGRWVGVHVGDGSNGGSTGLAVWGPGYDFARPPRSVGFTETDSGNTWAVFSPCGRWLAVPAGPGRFDLIATESGKRAFALTGNLAGQPAVAFTPDDRRVMGCFASQGRMDVQVWDTESGQELVMVPCGPDAKGLAVPPYFDGRRLVVVRRLGTHAEVLTLDGTPVPDDEACIRLTPPGT